MLHLHSFRSLCLITLTAALTTSSCKKSNTSTESGSGSQTSAQDGQTMTTFRNNNAPKFESFTFDAAAGAVLTSSKGTTYTIPATAFQTSTGVTVTGSVTVDIKEISQPSEMIFGDKPTLTRDGRMLLSYGEFFIRAAQGSQTLQLRNDSTIKVQVKAKPNGQEIPMWSGDSSITATLSGYDYLNTAITLSVQTSVHTGVQWDQLNTSYAFFNGSNGTLDFKIDSLVQWRNCDAIISNSDPKTTMLCYFTSHYNIETTTDYMGDQPTMLYFKPRNQNTLIKFYNTILNAPAGFQGLLSYQSSIPVGMEGTFLAMSTVNGKFYAQMIDTTIAAPVGSNNYTTLSFDPQEVSESTMVSLITQMNAK